MAKINSPGTFRTALIASLLILAGCASGPTIRSDVDPAVNFSEYKTFGFHQPLDTDSPSYGTLLSARLKANVRSELVTRGLTYSESDPELRIDFHANVKDKQEYRSAPYSLGIHGCYGYGYRPFGYCGGFEPEITSYEYKQSALVIDVIDVKRSEVVWQGSAEGRISEKELQNPAAATNEQVMLIMQRFPLPGPAAITEKK